MREVHVPVQQLNVGPMRTEALQLFSWNAVGMPLVVHSWACTVNLVILLGKAIIERIRLFQCLRVCIQHDNIINFTDMLMLSSANITIIVL